MQPRPGGFPPPLQFPPFPHKQRVPRLGPERGEADPLTARTGPYNLALRERGVQGRVAAAEPPSIRGFGFFDFVSTGPAVLTTRGSDSNGAKAHVKGRSWDRLASQDLSPSVSQGTIWRYVAVDRRLGYA